ncbi:MAG: hypothetical protein ACYDAJ_11495 [Nitrosotalea sp.]
MVPPNSSPTPYESKVEFSIPSGIDTIATDSNSWATGGNLVCFLTNGNYVECSFTYVYNTSSVSNPNVTSAGWYFWYAYISGSTKIYENYVSLPSTSFKVGDDVIVYLYNNSGTWYAQYDDITQSSYSNIYQIQNAPNVTISTSTDSIIMMENSDGTCSDYSSFNKLQFSNFYYLDSSQNPTSQSVTVDSLNPTINGLPSCRTVTSSTLTIT